VIVKPRDEDLMRYLDGELTPQEARQVEQHLEAEPTAQRKAEAMTQLGEVMRSHYDHAVDQVEDRLAGMWARLEGQLGATPAAREEAPHGLWAAIKDWFEVYRGHVFTGAACAAAAGVIAFLAARGGQETRVQERIVYVDREPQPTIVMAKAQDAEVESVEVTGGSAMIFQIPGESDEEAATAVIWLTTDGDTKTEDPI
jgi:anti-sigma factor RsiW